jgi:ribonucleoside-diphosphate reductase beta chain
MDENDRKSLLSMEKNEPILIPSNNRYIVVPSRMNKDEKEQWKMHKKGEAAVWTADEINLSQDRIDFRSLKKDEKFFFKHILAFFASADGIVMENICLNFSGRVQSPAARAFYSFQVYIENVHAETYSKMIVELVDESEHDELFNSVGKYESIAKKTEWAKKWMGKTASFSERLVAFACVEGIFFSGAFCSIFWFKKRGLLPGLTFSNELISKDEGLHCEFAALLYNQLKYTKLPQSRIQEIVGDAVMYECDFVTKSLPVDLIGMNADLMCQYIRFVADRLVGTLGHKKFYNVTNPFTFMDLISMEGKTNFFEKEVGDYRKADMECDSDSDDYELDSGSDDYELDSD